MAKTYPLPEAGIATDATKVSNRTVAQSLPLSDQADFDKACRGLIAILDGPIKTDEGHVAMGILPKPKVQIAGVWRIATFRT